MLRLFTTRLLFPCATCLEHKLYGVVWRTRTQAFPAQSEQQHLILFVFFKFYVLFGPEPI